MPLLVDMPLDIQAEITRQVSGLAWEPRVDGTRFESEGPLQPSAYSMSMTHLFGTARMGADPRKSVVRPDFRHHHTAALYVADSSVFPGNLGVNPQIAIMALARLCAECIAL